MASKDGKKGFSRNKLQPYYIIIAVIIVLLVIILIIMKAADTEAVVTETEVDTSTGTIVPQSDSGIVKPEDDDTAPVDVDGSTVDTIDKKPSLVFVIDDVGNSIEQLKPFLELPFSITFAIMPDRRYTTQCASLITSAGKEYILHQPMEPIGGQNPGESAIYTDMSEDEIDKILSHNFAQLPAARGMNNHMGSAATSDFEVMTSVMKFLKPKSFYYFDSYTIAGSVALEAANETNVLCLKRNSMFLDNEDDRTSIINAIEEGTKTASKKGHAVMIGHVMTKELAEIMMQLYPDFIEDGFSLKDISELFLEMNSPILED
ncbi:MAG: divergent polysaccharide deacetylase family protein [Spirochaetales bacterium]|nr:divergent polysaccharide deacetylase family protein [Spirochaetales bacterium]